MKQRVYYPLKPTKTRRYSTPASVVYLYIHTDADNTFIEACGVANGEYSNLTIEEVIPWVLSFPHNTWIITFDIDNWTAIIDQLINGFTRITGIGKENHVLRLENGKDLYHVIDVFPFFVCGISEALSKLGIITKRIRSARNYVLYLFVLWKNFTEFLGNEFALYPSKTPGATAIKLWRRFLPDTIKARGKVSSKFLRSAIMQPALHWRAGSYDNAYLYDINAAYVHCMKILRFPMRAKLFSNSPPPSYKWIATVNLSYDTPLDFAPVSIPVFEDNNISPTRIIKSRITLTYLDYMNLSITGNATIHKWIEGVYWYNEDEEDLFSAWAEDIERVSSYNPFYKLALKIISRSLHSKFNQNLFYTFTEIIRVNVDTAAALVKQPGKVLDVIVLDNGEMAIKKATRKRSTFKPFERPDWEALIMAAARYMIYSTIDDDTIYTHTDCFISTRERTDIDTGSRFGQWKLADNGKTDIAGLGVYAIGAEVGKSGFHINDELARMAIAEAARGGKSVVKSQQYPDIFSPDKAGEIDFTVRNQVYPRSRLEGNRAFISRSPERLHRRKIQKLFLITGGTQDDYTD